jgi:hypothetical protein
METQVHGCTLVGSRYGALANDDRSAQMAILNSRATLAQLIGFVGTGEHSVDYHWAQGCEPTACHA